MNLIRFEFRIKYKNVAISIVMNYQHCGGDMSYQQLDSKNQSQHYIFRSSSEPKVHHARQLRKGCYQPRQHLFEIEVIALNIWIWMNNYYICNKMFGSIWKLTRTGAACIHISNSRPRICLNIVTFNAENDVKFYWIKNKPMIHSKKHNNKPHRSACHREIRRKRTNNKENSLPIQTLPARAVISAYGI